MKLLVILAVIGSVVARSSGYKYDQTFIDELLENERVLKGFANCLDGTGACTQEGTALKNQVAELVSTSCAKCSDIDKANTAKLAFSLRNKFPEKFEAILKKFHLDGTKLSELNELMKKTAS